MRLRFLSPALSDLAGISRHIAQENPKAARKVVAEIRGQTGILVQHPQSGRLGRVSDTRELVISLYPYIVTYRVENDEVQILAVVHTSRCWPENFGE